MTERWFKRARRVMTGRQISQQKLAQHMGITRGAVGHWLSGRREPSLDELQKIATFLNVSYGWLTSGEGEQEAVSPQLAENVGFYSPDSQLDGSARQQPQPDYTSSEAAMIRRSAKLLRDSLADPRNEVVIAIARMVRAGLYPEK